MNDLKQRLRKATEGVTGGPWEWKNGWYDDFGASGSAPRYLANPNWNGQVGSGTGIVLDADTSGGEYAYSLRFAPDARFIAEARTLVPEALARIEELEEALEKLEGVVLAYARQVAGLTDQNVPPSEYRDHLGW